MFRYRKLENGVTVLIERLPGVRSVAAGICVQKGSRHENPADSGITHFLEHLLFKGTRSMDSRKLAREMDLLGGQFDAGTSREFLCILSRFLDENTEKALDIITEMICEPAFPLSEIEKEKQVVLDEIRMYQDDPEEQVQEMLFDLCWNGNAISRPILGFPENILRVSRPGILRFHDRFWDSEKMVVALTGNIDVDRAFDQLSRRFVSFQRKADDAPVVKPVFHAGVRIEQRPVEQTYFSIAIPWHPYNHPDKYTGLLVNSILGGNMSSRLFQEVREKKGLTYSIGSYESCFIDTGVLIIYASVQKENVGRAVDLSLGCLDDLAAGNISAQELENAKMCLKSNVVMGFEGTSRRMNTLVRQYMSLGRCFSMDEIISRIESVELTAFKELCAERLGNPEKSLVVLGPLDRSVSMDQPISRKALPEILDF